MLAVFVKANKHAAETIKKYLVTILFNKAAQSQSVLLIRSVAPAHCVEGEGCVILVDLLPLATGRGHHLTSPWRHHPRGI